MASANGYEASFRRLEGGLWGVAVEGPDAPKFAGKTVSVTKRSGEVKDVELHELVQQWDGGTKASYTVRPKKGAPPVRPRGTVEVTKADLAALRRDGTVSVDGVTLVLS